VEITETLLMEDRGHSDAMLRALCGLGVQVAVDDYGTGYSGLAYLRDLPVNQLKIDRTFVGELGDHRTATIVASTIELGHDLGLAIVAEGVENEQQLAWLDRHGCDLVQGYHLGHPMSSTLLRTWLTERALPRAAGGGERVTVPRDRDGR
jgi:EAL domain-containing protein (putative c-di-GMP-specific phosphodiesterase class I)